MATPMVYGSGAEIRENERVLLHGEPGEIEDICDDARAKLNGYPGRGIMIAEPKCFGHLFLKDSNLANYEDLEFVSRSD